MPTKKTTKKEKDKEQELKKLEEDNKVKVPQKRGKKTKENPPLIKAKVFRSGVGVTRSQFVKEFSDITGLSEETSFKAVEAFEDLIMQHIALEDILHFTFGNIYGYTKIPVKITGYYSVLKKVMEKGGWTVAKSGYPGIEWSEDAKYYTATHPDAFFEWDEIKYTSAARKYRQDRGYPEIDAYIGKTEDEIKEICAKADFQAFGIRETTESLKQKEKKKKKKKKREQGYEEYMKEVDREIQLKNGVKEEDLVEHTREEILEMQKVEWIKRQKPTTGLPTKKRNYEVPERLKDTLLEQDKKRYEENQLKKYLENDSQFYVDKNLLERVSEQQEEFKKNNIIGQRVEVEVTLPEKSVSGLRTSSLGKITELREKEEKTREQEKIERYREKAREAYYIKKEENKKIREENEELKKKIAEQEDIIQKSIAKESNNSEE